MDAALKAIAEYGLAIVALVCVALFAFWLVRKLLDAKDAQIADLSGRCDEAMAGWRGQAAATDKLADLFVSQRPIRQR